MSGRVFLHVGSPKTGTSFLQTVLWTNRETLRQQGVLLPGDSRHAHFRATFDLRENPQRSARPERVPGTWQKLVHEARSWSGDVVISHELLAPATREQAQRGIDAFERQGREVHVVLTARDMARQLPAEWQERVKHGGGRSFSEFLAAVQDGRTRAAKSLWAAQDYAEILLRWGSSLPAEQVHVVTVPPPGAPRGVLWERFAGVLGLEPGDFDIDVPGGNTSIGLEQAEVLRRVNRALGRRLSLPGPYTTLVKGAFAHGVLSRRPGTKLLLGGEDLEYARKRSAEIVDRLRDAGYDVVGDLADLTVPLTDTGPETTTARQVPDAEVLLRESIEATADLLVELQGRVEQWQQERTDLRDKLREARAVSPGRRVSSPGRAAVSRARNGLSRITGRHR